MRILLGEFDYLELRSVNSLMAPLLFNAYLLVVFFILLNMFLAIINDAYVAVKEEQTEEDLNFYINLKNKVAGKLKKFIFRKDEINKLARDLMNEDALADGQLDIDELKEALKDNPRALELLETTTVEELVAKYDVDKDGKLSRDELKEILTELAAKEADLTSRIEDQKVKASNYAGLAAAREGMVGGGGMGGIGEEAFGELEVKIDRLETDLRDMSRQMAKKMAMMIDLMMALSDQVQVSQGGMASQTPGRG